MGPLTSWEKNTKTKKKIPKKYQKNAAGVIENRQNREVDFFAVR